MFYRHINRLCSILSVAKVIQYGSAAVSLAENDTNMNTIS